MPLPKNFVQFLPFMNPFSADSEYPGKSNFWQILLEYNDMLNLKVCLGKDFQNEQIGRYTIFF